MGVTIHFDGRVRSAEHALECLALVREFADANSLECREIERKTRTLRRVQNDEDWDYTGETFGVELTPHPNCDPFRFEIDEDLYIQEYCKTQFAPIEVHVQVVKLLRGLMPHFEVIDVFDEGEFMESDDLDRLRELRGGCLKALEDIKKEDPKAQGPVRMKDGRIIDVLT